MKHKFTAALLAAGLLTCSNCLAALEYNYDRETKQFTVKSEEIIPLEDGTNQLTVSFNKEYVLTPDKRGRMPKDAQPTFYLHMTVIGSKDYRFADNANYWQEHNYTYEEMEPKYQYDLDRADLDRQKQLLKAEQNETPKPTPEQKSAWLERKEVLSAKEKELNEKAEIVVKDPKKLGRNPSTLIYLKVENKLEGENKAKPLYDFGVGSDKMPDILVEKEIKDQTSQREKMVEQVKATRDAFYKYQKEQKEAMKGLKYTSIATAKLPKGDNFWKKVINSAKTNTPLFFEVKFWNGGANQRLWLKNDKLQELNELLNYDLYKDEVNLENIKK